jgi:hypothetical protein
MMFSILNFGYVNNWPKLFKGVEQGTYKFITPGNYTAEVTIYYILFAPVQPDIAKFNIAAVAAK